jgi:hypothetical protein
MIETSSWDLPGCLALNKTRIIPTPRGVTGVGIIRKHFINQYSSRHGGAKLMTSRAFSQFATGYFRHLLWRIGCVSTGSPPMDRPINIIWAYATLCSRLTHPLTYGSIAISRCRLMGACSIRPPDRGNKIRSPTATQIVYRWNPYIGGHTLPPRSRCQTACEHNSSTSNQRRADQKQIPSDFVASHWQSTGG